MDARILGKRIARCAARKARADGHDSRRRRHGRGASPVDVARSLRPAGQDADAARAVHRHLRSHGHAAVAVRRLRRPRPAAARRRVAERRAQPTSIDSDERDGFARSWDGDTAYIFILRDGTDAARRAGRVCQDGSSGARPFSLVQGLLRPALQVLSRELVNQYNIGDLQQESARCATAISNCCSMRAARRQSDDSDDFEPLLRNCVDASRLRVRRTADPRQEDRARASRRNGASGAPMPTVLEKTQRHLFAWAQVQRRTLMLNKAPPNSPLGALPYKILACPIRHGAQQSPACWCCSGRCRRPISTCARCASSR